MEGPQADIGKIANRRGHHIQGTLGIILSRRRGVGCGTGRIK
jgi:hypothetical protein